MGLKYSKRINTVAVGDDDPSTKNYAIVRAQRDMQKNFKISLQRMVAHYTPSFFPMNPKITKNGMKLCRDSWEKLISKDVPDPYGGRAMSGLAACYTEFYERYRNYQLLMYLR
jgi:hypothetical protein